MRRHDLGDGHAEAMFFLVVEKGEAVEPDHAVGDAAFAKAVAYGFCYADDNLWWEMSLGSMGRMEK